MPVIKLAHADDQSDDGIESWPKAYRSDKALPCPFCGFPPIILPWHGGTKHKRMIMCRAAPCTVEPSITGNTEKLALENWNTRA